MLVLAIYWSGNIYFASSYPAHMSFPLDDIQALPSSVLYGGKKQEYQSHPIVCTVVVHTASYYRRPAASSALCKQHQKLIQTVLRHRDQSGRIPPLCPSVLLTANTK